MQWHHHLSVECQISSMHVCVWEGGLCRSFMVLCRLRAPYIFCLSLYFSSPNYQKHSSSISFLFPSKYLPSEISHFNLLSQYFHFFSIFTLIVEFFLLRVVLDQLKLVTGSIFLFSTPSFSECLCFWLRIQQECGHQLGWLWVVFRVIAILIFFVFWPHYFCVISFVCLFFKEQWVNMHLGGCHCP